MVKALSLVTMPVLTRYLSPETYGQAALVTTVVSLVSVLAIAGIDMGYMRHIFSNQTENTTTVEIFSWRWTISTSGIASIFIGLLWWQWADRLSLATSLAGFVSAGIFMSALQTMAQTRARLENRYAQMSWVQLATGCICAATSICIAVFWRQDAWALLVTMLMGYAIPVFLLGTPSWRQLARPSGLNQSQRNLLLSTGLAGVVTAPAYWVLSSSDRWFLVALHSSSEVGIYSIGFTVGTIGAAVSTAITGAWLPELARTESANNFGRQKAEMVQMLTALLMIVAVAVVASGGDVIRALADARFHSAAAVVPWLAVAVFFYGCLHIGNALLVMTGKLHWAGWAWTITVLTSLLMNAWLVPGFGVLGAAITQAVSFLLAMILIWTAVLIFEPIRLHWIKLISGITFSFILALLMQSTWSDAPWYSLALKLPVGLLYAALCLYVVAPGAFKKILNEFKGKTNVRIGG